MTAIRDTAGEQLFEELLYSHALYRYPQSLSHDLSYMLEKHLLFGTSKKLCFFVRERDLL
ncbi:MAG: hypothetical protein J4469_04165 [Candidatus Aenigmarchaeota archaeon]|nr:hypothetical protein [Candidatus Aenigmarchaeota archaeon]